MSSDQIAIQVNNLCKYYFVYQKPEDRLKQYLMPRIQRLVGRPEQKYFREFKALDNISFEVNKGEAVGIVGRNGAGKSTLLQLICGTLTQTSGDIYVNGKVAALLELGSGFNHQFTGRENVYLNASLLGLSKEETDNKFDEIAAFADIGEYIEQPTKTYSSGMLMRLAFAVNTCVEPEIMIVDEALGVGDAPFQSKCFKRLRNLIDIGTTILFVSHSISTVRSICSRALWLKHGRAELWGDAKYVTKEYEKFCWAEQGVQVSQNDESITDIEEDIESNSADEPGSESMENANEVIEDKNSNQTWEQTIAFLSQSNLLQPVTDSSSRLGNQNVEILALTMTNSTGEITTEVEYGERITLHYKLQVNKKVKSEFMIGARIRNLQGDYVCSMNDLDAIHVLDASPGSIVYVRNTFNLPLTHGDFIVRTGIFGFKDGIAIPQEGYDFSRAILWDIREEALFIKVSQYKLMPLPGPVNIKSRVEILVH